MEPTIQSTADGVNSSETTLESTGGDEIVTQDGDIRIFDAEEPDDEPNSLALIGIGGMATCFLCFGLLMFVHSKRKREANQVAEGTGSNMNNQEMTLIHVDDERKRATSQSDTLYKKRKTKDTMTPSCQSSGEQLYLPISYDGNENGDNVMTNNAAIAALPEDDEVSMSDSADDDLYGNLPNESSESLKGMGHRKMSKSQKAMRKRSRGSIVRSELKQLSKHMADVLHSNK